MRPVIYSDTKTEPKANPQFQALPSTGNEVLERPNPVFLQRLPINPRKPAWK